MIPLCCRGVAMLASKVAPLAALLCDLLLLDQSLSARQSSGNRLLPQSRGFAPRTSLCGLRQRLLSGGTSWRVAQSILCPLELIFQSLTLALSGRSRSLLLLHLRQETLVQGLHVCQSKLQLRQPALQRFGGCRLRKAQDLAHGKDCRLVASCGRRGVWRLLQFELPDPGHPPVRALAQL